MADSMTLKEFQDALKGMTEAELEQFVVELLARSGRFTGVRMFHGAREYGKDIEAFESDRLLPNPRRWVFEVKNMRLVSADVANYLRFMANRVRHEDPTVQFVLVTSGSLTNAALDNLKGTSRYGTRQHSHSSRHLTSSTNISHDGGETGTG